MSVVVAYLEGELDAVFVTERRAELLTECDRHAGSVLLLDLSEVTFVDSTGLGLLIGVARRMREGGGEVRLRGCRRSVRRVLSVSGLDAVVAVDDAPAPLPIVGDQR
jgi:anti-sigma B factor antagonist